VSSKKDRPRRARKPMPPGREALPRRADAVAARRAARPQVALAEPTAGRAIVTASWGGTAALAVTACAAAAAPHPFETPALIVALVLFFAGIVAFFWAYAIAVGRSRLDAVGLPGVFGLSGSAPTSVRVRLLGSVAAQLAVAVATASIRLYSSLSFGLLAVMWGLGLTGLWGARYGAFPPRPPETERRRRPR